MPFNFRVRLIESLVRINAWDKLDYVLSTLYEDKFDLSLSKTLVETMILALEWFIEPLYRPLALTKTPPNAKL